MTKKKAGLQVLKLGATTKSSESINTVSSLYYVLFHTSTVLIGIHVVHAIMLSEERAESSNLPLGTFVGFRWNDRDSNDCQRVWWRFSIALKLKRE